MDDSKINVLYVNGDYTMGGASASLLNMIHSLGDEVNPIVLFPQVGIGLQTFLNNGIESYVYPFPILYLFKENRLLDIWHHPWRWHYIKKWRNDVATFMYIKQILNGRKIDIVHSNASVFDVGVYLSKHLCAKHVWHIREFIDKHFRFEIYGGLESLRKKFNNADVRIAISNAVRIHHQLVEQNTYTIFNAIRSVDDAVFYPLKEKYILFVANYITKAKGIGQCIESFEKSGLFIDGYKLKIVGNIIEDYKEELCSSVANFQCKDSIELIPFTFELKELYAKASAFIMASECEGLGRVTAEAMFYGCPVIARASGGTLDIVKNGDTGYLYNTVDECAQLMRNVCFTNQEAVILRAKNFVCANLSQECYGPKILDVYKNVLNRCG